MQPAPADVPLNPGLPEAAAAPAPAAGRVSGRLADVWTRTEPRYRQRAIVLLAVNILLYSGLCVFTHWLHVGRLFDFSLQSYAEPARFWGEQTRTLHDFILFPISVEQTPIHGIVLALLLASIVAVPIVTAILYRIPAALPLAAAVAVFAHMPWMAATLALSCTLAGWRPIRMSFRFGSALLGMLPVIVYIYLALRGGPEAIGSSASPAQRTQLLAPWVLGILAGCAMMGVILLIAHLVRYRPGAITPVMAVMFAAPVLLFHAYVGTDELAYRVVEVHYAPRGAHFMAMQDPAAVQQRIGELFERWNRPDNPAFREDLLATLSGDPERLRARVRRRFTLDFLADRNAASEACRQFLAQHPQSRYVPSMLYIHGRVLDLRIDERGLIARPPRVELYDDFPNAASEPVWAALWNYAGQSRLAVLAGLRLAQHHLRRGEVEEAVAKLQAVQHAPLAAEAAPAAQSPMGALLVSRAPDRSLDFDPRPYQVEAARLLELIEGNRDDPLSGNQALTELFRLDTHRPGYAAELQRLIAEFPRARLRDNLLVQWAVAVPDLSRRAEVLRAIIGAHPQGDAQAEALFRLADLEIQALGGKDEAARALGLERMRQTAARFADSFWGRQAAERLLMLEPAGGKLAEGRSLP